MYRCLLELRPSAQGAPRSFKSIKWHQEKHALPISHKGPGSTSILLYALLIWLLESIPTA